MAKTNYKNYRELEVAEWNATSFREFAKDLHLARFGVPYVANNIRVENGMISAAAKAWGKPVVKKFIEVCINEYTPSANYPGVNFAFMYSYMKGKVPKSMQLVQREAASKQVQQKTQNIDFTSMM